MLDWDSNSRSQRVDLLDYATGLSLDSRSVSGFSAGQYLVWKKWSRWVLAYGSHPEDALLADAYRRAAKRFGARIVKELEYKDTGGARQTDSGVDHGYR